MSPTPLIDLQRRLSLVGAIRAGGEKQPKAPGRKLENWRITSARKALIEQAAALYGGDVTPWQSPVGQEYQTYTAVDELPVLLMPSYSLRQTYELWEGATKRMRLCDGVDEELSGGPCICNQTGDDKCDLYTRLVVALPELDTLLGWRVITKGLNAAHELPTMLDAARATSDRPFVPARLRLEQRRGVVNEQVTRFVVPTLDLGVGYAALAAGNGSQALLTPADRDVHPVLEASTRAPAREDNPAPPDLAPPDEPHEGHMLQRDEPMWKKLNVLVGTLREGGHITTDGLYEAIASLRETAGLDLAAILNGYDEEHVLHWSPLRDSLTRSEAHQLIDWLVEKERRVNAGGAGGDGPERPDDTPDAPAPDPPPVHGRTPNPVPYNEFPPGY